MDKQGEGAKQTWLRGVRSRFGNLLRRVSISVFNLPRMSIIERH